jgi:hypothetical protein
MIIEGVKKSTQTSGSFQTSGFRIDASAKAFKLLSSNPYKFKVRAVIRELTCNALDANTDAEVSAVPRVHLPTKLEPWFSVADNGKGLSPDDVRDVYTVYFCSTKTNSNKLIGALGIGAKVAYSIVDSFIVKSVNDGVKYTYSAYKDEDDLPQMALLSSSPTDEPSGVEVIVNVMGRDYEFQDEAVEVFKYFDVIPEINISSVKEKIVAAREFKVKGDGFAFNTGYGQCKAVMGNVAYDIPHGYGLDIDGYIRFEIGDLDFDLGRESLSLDNKTIANLKARVNQVKEGMADHIIGLIEAEDTEFKRAKMFDKVNCGVLGNIIECNKKKFDYVLPHTSTEMSVYSKTYKSVNISHMKALPLSADYYRFKPKFTARIKSYLKDHGGKIVVLTDAQISECKIDLDVIKDLDTLPKIVYARGPKSKSIKVRSCVNGCWNEAQLDTSEHYVYIETMHGKPSAYSGYHAVNSLVSAAKKLGADIDVIYGLSPSVKNKGQGVELREFLKENLVLPEKAILDKPTNQAILSKVDKRFAKKDLDSDIISLYNLFDVAHDDTLDKLSERYSTEFPLLKFISYHYYSKPTDAELLTYLKELK